jgi:hypothetical protein
VTGPGKAWSVLLRGVETVQAVEGGSARPDALGTLVTAAAGKTELAITL